MIRSVTFIGGSVDGQVRRVNVAYGTIKVPEPYEEQPFSRKTPMVFECKHCTYKLDFVYLRPNREKWFGFHEDIPLHMRKTELAERGLI